ncbi:MAG: hypothetical protein Ta2B_16160 [Termitinemataceae bacterium]|nr:MAG: hypothetical protein Ta2B_16160 [Termitinemataceae bacterium]
MKFFDIQFAHGRLEDLEYYKRIAEYDKELSYIATNADLLLKFLICYVNFDDAILVDIKMDKNIGLAKFIIYSSYGDKYYMLDIKFYDAIINSLISISLPTEIWCHEYSIVNDNVYRLSFLNTCDRDFFWDFTHVSFSIAEVNEEDYFSLLEKDQVLLPVTHLQEEGKNDIGSSK